MFKSFAIAAAGQRLKAALRPQRPADAAVGPETGPLIWFCAAICLSAALIFSIQPLFAKMALPRLGGAPSVWTTAMLFFQTLLLAGYAYAHWLSSRFSSPRQVAIHLAVVAVGALFLPFAAPSDWTPTSDGASWQLLTLLAVSVGAPFFALAANAPLLQSWYGATRGRGAEDPYFLYAASNVGSFAALLAFPLLLEPIFGAAEMARYWAIGYALFGATLLASAYHRLRAQTPTPPMGATIEAQAEAETPERLSTGRVLTWIGLAAVPSSLMLGVTSTIATDVGSFPLVWLGPLALYLATFVIAFSAWGPRTAPMVERTHVLFTVAIVAVFVGDLVEAPGLLVLFVYLTGMFFAALAFHNALVARRPGREGLTAFYLSMSAGGALGGLFNSLIAPAAFDGVYEYPIAIALSTLVAGRLLAPLWRDLRVVALGVAPLALFAMLVAIGVAPDMAPLAAIGAAVVAITMLHNAGHVRRFAPLAFLSLGIGHVANVDGAVETRARSFFGSYEVFIDAAAGQRVFAHGTAYHGKQNLSDVDDDPTTRPEPLAYYYRGGVFGQAIDIAKATGARRIGVVGLGAGALACFKAPDEEWEFFEIDPLVVEIAQDRRYFTYMSDCAPNSAIRIGDARIELEKDQAVGAPPYDLLILDAFSSDAIPLHLLTQEAMALYGDRLAEGGVLAIHISNRYYLLEGPVSAAGAAAGFHAVYQHHEMTPQEQERTGGFTATMVALSRDQAALRPFLEGGRWRPAVADDGAPWTDDSASLLPYLPAFR